MKNMFRPTNGMAICVSVFMAIKVRILNLIKSFRFSVAVLACAHMFYFHLCSSAAAARTARLLLTTRDGKPHSKAMSCLLSIFSKLSSVKYCFLNAIFHLNNPFKVQLWSFSM